MNQSNFGTPVRLTATGDVLGRSGRLLGFYVASTTGGTLVLRNNGASGDQLTGTITPAVGWHPLPIGFSDDLHATIANALDVTFVIT